MQGMKEYIMNKIFSIIFRLALIAILTLIAIYLFLHSDFFNINKIIVNGTENVYDTEIIDLSGIEIGDNLFQINKNILVKSIEIHPMVKTAEIKRKIPKTVEINIQERVLWTIIPHEGIFLCVDEHGICIDKSTTLKLGQLPILTFDELPDRINLGQAVESDLLEMALELWTYISEERRDSISQFHFQTTDKSLYIYTLNGTEIRFGNKERLEEKAQFLEQVFVIEEDLEEEAKVVLEYVDLRFKGQPIIKTRN